jgi:hypothetical protein
MVAIASKDNVAILNSWLTMRDFRPFFDARAVLLILIASPRILLPLCGYSLVGAVFLLNRCLNAKKKIYESVRENKQVTPLPLVRYRLKTDKDTGRETFMEGG